MLEILIVDDQADLRRYYGKALRGSAERDRWAEALGFPGPVQVSEAATCREACHALASRPPDVLIVDLKIEGCGAEEYGGLTVITESIRLDPLRPIVAITGHADEEGLYRESTRRGTSAFLEKSKNSPRLVVETVRRVLELHLERLVRIGNPFTRTNAEPRVFGGRDAELGRFDDLMKRALETGTREHFRVLGEWGLGKTTLLREFKRISQGRGIPAAVVPLESLGRGAVPGQAVRSIAEGILRALPIPMERLSRMAAGLEASAPDGAGTRGTGGRRRRELPPLAFLQDALLNLWEDLRGESPLVLVLLDDLDNLASVPEIVVVLKQALATDAVRQTGIVFGITTTPRFWNRLTRREPLHPLTRAFMTRLTLAPLQRGEFEETVTRTAAGVGVRFESEIVARAFAHTGGHPFEMQVLCYHLFDNQIARRVGPEGWEKALEATLDDMGEAIFEHWLSRISPAEHHLLRLAAASAAPLSPDEVRARAAASGLLLQPEAVHRHLKRMANLGMMGRERHGLFSVPDPMFVAYLAREARHGPR